MTSINVVLFFASVLSVTAAGAAKDDPVQRVVKLIQELKAGIESDGKAEQKTYDKFACWCEKTLARKAASIDEAKETIDKTQREIIELKGKLGELGATLKQLEKEIAENEEGRKEATEIREKENEDYEVEKTEGEQCIGALESAIKVMTGAGEKKAMLETLQEAQLLSVVAGVKGVLRRVPSSDALKDSDLNMMKDFVENPTKYVSEGFSGAQISNPNGDYAPASAQIQGILKGMYDSFTADLEKANAEEADKQKSFEELMETKLQEHATLTATLEAKTKENADATKLLADDKTLLQATKEQLEADEKFFEETKAACKAKAAEWAERSRMRTEELQGMEKAVEILTSDEAKATFDSAHSTLLQVSANVQDEERSAAYSKLKALVKKGGGLRLAFLAAELRSGGHFDKVITMIDRMIKDLRVEEQDDIKARDICENEENALNAQKEDLNYNIKKKKEEIERLDAKKEEAEKSIEAKEAEIEQTKKTMGEMLAARNEETADFKKAVKDDVDAVNLLGKAIDALTAFYTNNKLPLGLVQEPEYSVDEDKAPDASFGGAKKSESTGIIAILGMLKEDSEKEIKTARAEEAEAQAEYEKQRGELTNTLNSQEKCKTDLEAEKADLMGKIADGEGEKENKIQMEKDTQGELDAQAPSCTWVKDTFDSRREKRQAEIEGLQEAKSILAGAPAAELLQNSFLQRVK